MAGIEMAVGSFADCVHCKKQSAGLYRLIRKKPGRFSLVCLSCYNDRESGAAKFWQLVDKDGPVIRPELGNCWTWVGGMLADGYGYFSHPTMSENRAHRAAWVLENGPINSTVHVLHKCDNPPCVRPEHLFDGDHQENMLDMHAKGRSHSLLTWESVRQLRDDHSRGFPPRELMKKFGIKYGTLYEAIRGKTWKESNAPSS